MAESSEATRRVFERMLVNLKGKLEPAAIEGLKGLIQAGKLGDLDAVEEVVRPKGDLDADR